MTKLTIKDISRSGSVTRWQIVRTSRKQTMAEHCFIVAMIADHIWKEMAKEIGMGPAREHLLLLQWALRHDLPEILTGDVSTPMKNRIRKLVEYDPFLHIDCDLDYEYKELYSKVSGTYLFHIVKIADLQEAIVFLDREVLTSHGHDVKRKLIEKHSKYIDDLVENAQVNRNLKFPWSICHIVLEELLTGPDGQMEFENE